MNDGDGERKENFIDKDFQNHENGHTIQASQDYINTINTPILNPTYDSSELDDDQEENGYKEEPVNHIEHNQEQPHYDD